MRSWNNSIRSLMVLIVAVALELVFFQAFGPSC